MGFKINWLEHFLTNNNSFLFCIPSSIFISVGGIEFFLRCDSLSNCQNFISKFFYTGSWFINNFSPHNLPIWNNMYILFRNKPLFISDWWERGIWSVVHLFDEEGNFMNHRTFCEKSFSVVTTNMLRYWIVFQRLLFC